ncbi:helix-turn-helix transcriptional regulator [Fournierella sp.]|uniref:helix-turn-helix domain-containing protein n=1 Tax=Allofournierella sp. TaxID=1940256 RepID=UPI0025C661C8|nr:helix-turn-helix transcriptional regulator [Fournierella sp.]
MTHATIFVYGYIFGIIKQAAPDALTANDFERCAMSPTTETARVISKMHSMRKITPDMDRKIAAAFAQITEFDEQDAHRLQPVELQGSWQRGYYAAINGQPLSAWGEITAARKAKGWSQAQLAEALDVSQAYISAVESGTRNATAEMTAKAKEVLGV